MVAVAQPGLLYNLVQHHSLAKIHSRLTTAEKKQNGVGIHPQYKDINTCQYPPLL